MSSFLGWCYNFEVWVPCSLGWLWPTTLSVIHREGKLRIWQILPYIRLSFQLSNIWCFTFYIIYQISASRNKFCIRDINNHTCFDEIVIVALFLPKYEFPFSRYQMGHNHISAATINPIKNRKTWNIFVKFGRPN